jgi:hypothetical protein
MGLKLFLISLLAAIFPFAVQAQSGTGNELVLSPKDTDKIEIDIRATFNGNTLIPGNKAYVNAHGDTFYIDAFRFYISNISFIGNRNVTVTNVHLFEVADTNSYSFLLKNIPPDVYNSIQFVVGVDSIANTSGANEGDLDPTKGMYWAWNSGYIMAKLEGHSRVCKTLHNAFEFHIGGYLPPNNAARIVTLKIPDYFQMGRPSLPTITLNADLSAWFRDIDLAKVNSILTPGKEAMIMADNYAKMFTIESVDFTPLNAR